MAKKKSGKKSGKRYERPAARAASTRKAVDRSTRVKPKRKGPRSQPLPGMEQVRDRVLDNLCEGIGDCRDTMNESRKEEKSLIAAALKRCIDKGVQAYKHAKVAMVVEPGAAKLRVRMVKEEGDAATTGGETETGGEVEERVEEEIPASERGIGGEGASTEVH